MSSDSDITSIDSDIDRLIEELNETESQWKDRKRQNKGQKRRRRKKFRYSLPTKRRNQREVKTDSNLYSIESVVDVRLSTEFKLLFCVHWKGYSHEDNTWQSIDDLFNCNKHFEEYFVNQFTEEVIQYDVNDWEFFSQCLSDCLSSDPDVAVLMKFNDIKMDSINSCDNKVIKMKENIDKYYNGMVDMEKRMRGREGMGDEFWPQKILIQLLVQKLNINKYFNDLKDFKDFVNQRKTMKNDLNEWELNINGQIARIGRPGDRISVENNIDFDVPPIFEFTTDYRLHSDLTIESSQLNHIHCNCDNNCLSSKCECALNLYKDNRRFRSTYVMYECNEDCVCTELCPNRRIQKKSIGSHLIVFKTEGRGWGLKTRKKIYKNEFIMEYTGRVLGWAQAYNKDETYFFNIDSEFCDQILFVDSKHCGNVSRFANHCCEPNMDLHFGVVSKTQLIPNIAFFANRNIKPFEELTYDYKRTTHSSEAIGNTCSQSASQTTTKEVEDIECMCGSSKCKNVI